MDLRPAAALSMLALIAMAAGCEAQRSSTDGLEMTVSTPLELDPTMDTPLARWWSDGETLLALDDDGGYARYDGMNRHRRPAERGRYERPSYAWLRLEPYARHEQQSIRVSIERADGELALRLADGARLYALDAPPETLEDRLMGSWESAGMTLDLRPDLQYRLQMETENGSAPVRIQRATGSWSIVDGSVRLVPYAANRDPERLDVVDDADDLRLVDAGGPWERIDE